ncbi:MAG: hypothetical protein KJ600_03130 [Nanoarchaeota archaeon]|nr:hypothetical protein [Nanoarchaeota archaeon]MBU1103520.1 hypothetical protein [Nanoarchaeota archaeon]
MKLNSQNGASRDSLVKNNKTGTASGNWANTKTLREKFYTEILTKDI